MSSYVVRAAHRKIIGENNCETGEIIVKQDYLTQVGTVKQSGENLLRLLPPRKSTPTAVVP